PKVEPTPFDKLDGAQTAAEERSAWHPKELVAVLGSDRGRHWKAVECVAYRPDGKQVASGGAEAVVRLWDAATLKQTVALTGHSGTITALAYAANGKVFASGGTDRTARLWFLSGDKAEEIAALAGHKEAVRAVAFGPNSKTLASASDDGTVKLWSLTGDKPTERFTLTGPQRPR